MKGIDDGEFYDLGFKDETIQETLERLLKTLNMLEKPGEEVIGNTIREILNILSNFNSRIQKLEKKEG